MRTESHGGSAISSQVVLAHEQAFRIGNVHVEPALRQVRVGRSSVTLEPRIMQVLVMLSRARGEIVTRDELVEACWSGRIVGNDAINRAISRIRRLGGELGEGCFTVETITKVGYRLHSAESNNGALPGVVRSPSAEQFAARRKLLGGIGAASVVAAIGGLAVIRSNRKSSSIPPEAQQLYDRADAMQTAASPTTWSLVVPYLEEAVRLAPHYGEAWGALALAYAIRIDSEPSRAADYRLRFAEALNNARRLAPGNADAEAAGILKDDHYGRWGRFELAYRGLIDRHPTYPRGHHMLGMLLMDVGRWSDAIDSLLTLQKLQPLAPLPSYLLIISLWSAGRISEVEEEIESARRRWPRHGAIWQTNIKVRALSGRPRAAIALLEDAESRPADDNGNFGPNMTLIARTLLTGEASDREAAIRAIEQNDPELPNAIYAAALDDATLAMDMIEGLFLARGRFSRPGSQAPKTTHPLFQPHARSLWGEPRFRNLLSEIGLESYWRERRRQPDHRARGWDLTPAH